MLTLPTYVLITPARNEAQFIERAILSVLVQTVRPVKWVIVSDGSTDDTDEIVSKYAVQHDWIELLRKPVRQERHFAGKVDAFNAGYERVKDLKYQVIGNLDADVSFVDVGYFEFLMNKFAEMPKLGVCGTSYHEGDTVYPFRFTSLEDVSGACQLFRRECYEAIGGYLPLKSGGIDVIAVLSAQAKGWKTRTFIEKSYLHHRQVASAQHTSLWQRLLQTGRKEYVLGNHPTWECFRSVYNMKNRPYVIGGVLTFAGYLWAMLQGIERTIPDELMELRRKEQMQRLKRILRHMLGFRS